MLPEAVAVAVRRAAGLKLAGLLLPAEALWPLANETLSPDSLLAEALLGARLGAYVYKDCKSACGLEDIFTPSDLTLLFEREVPAAARLAALKAEALAKGMIFARDIINAPANIATPERMEAEAADLAARHGFKFSSHGPDWLQQQGLNAFLSVSLGSAREPRLLILEYTPPGAEQEAPVVLVGKGITFDSGGISLKPAEGMERMKRDMAGAGTVLGLFAALGGLLSIAGAARPRPVLGLMPCTENMPGGRASKPGDVVRTLSGKSVEIVNTDAEGRLILCDCLTLAQKISAPAAIIDIATLTGACVVALGQKAAGLFGNDRALIDKLLALSGNNGERMWPMPIWDEDLDTLKEQSSADFNNAGPREGGASFAALFLKQFIGRGIAWAHLDIAGPAFKSKAEPAAAGGASAFGLRTLWDFVTGESLWQPHSM